MEQRSCQRIFLFGMALLLFLLPLYAGAQVSQEWVQRYNGNADDYDMGYAIAVDSDRNAYVTGTVEDSLTGQDLIVIKYDTNGNTVWSVTYDGGGTYPNSYDGGRDIAVDAAGNVYVTGNSSLGGSQYGDIFTIKYDTNGQELWTGRYAGSYGIGGWGQQIYVDASGNVYVFATVHDGETVDFGVIKYNAAGTQLWAQEYGVYYGWDQPADMAVDNDGNVYICGMTIPGSTGTEYVVVKYDADGVQQWEVLYNGTSNLNDGADAIAVDDSGYVYVAGTTVLDYYPDNAPMIIAKYDPAGTELWMEFYSSGTNTYNAASDLVLDDSGNIYITGNQYLWTTHYNYLTVKYNNSGTFQWATQYDGASGDDHPVKMAIDPFNNIYVTGQSENIWDDPDYATVKYNSDGASQWVMRYNSPVIDSTDNAMDIALDVCCDVYVTGLSEGVAAPGDTTWHDILTIKYDQHLAPLMPPTAVSPANGATAVPYNPTSFSWTSLPCATSYNIQVSTDPGFGALAYNANVVGTTTSCTLNPGTTYYWRLDGENPYGTSGWSTSWSFTTDGTGGGTVVGPGNVSGTWTSSGSPYLVNGGITVPAGQTLVIDPGVVINFQGPYGITVNGSIQANGNSGSPITFTASNPGVGWTGIQLISTSSGSSFTWCVFQYGNANGNPNVNGGVFYVGTGQSYTFNYCTFQNNYAQNNGGVFYGLYSPVFNYCTFINNGAGNTAGALYFTGPSSSPYINHCIFSGNTANIAGAIYLGPGCAAYIINCTLYGNSLEGIYIDNNNSVVTNTIVTNSGSVGIYIVNGAYPTINFGNYYGNPGGPFGGPSVPPGLGVIVGVNYIGTPCDGGFNIYVDPLFVDALNNDFNLTATSLCIDAGDPSVVLDPDGTVADIGALYYHHTGSPPSMPTLSDPPDGTIGVVFNALVLSWGVVSGATSYHIQIAYDAGFTNVFVDTYWIQGTSYIAYLNPGTSYWWRVCSHNAYGFSSWSAGWSFTTQANLPGEPVLGLPVDGAINVVYNPATFTWSPAMVGSLPDYYTIEIALDVNFTSIVVSDTTSALTYTFTLNPFTTYYWHVSGTSWTFGAGPFSTAFSFTTGSPFPVSVLIRGEVPGPGGFIIADCCNWAALDSSATDDYDPLLDVPAPPPPQDDYIYIYFPHPEWGSIFGDNFMIDVRNANDDLTADVKVFEFEVMTDQLSANIDLIFYISSTFPSNYGVVLYDVELGVYQNLWGDSTYTYVSGGTPGVHHFELIIGNGAPPSISYIAPTADEILYWNAIYTVLWDVTITVPVQYTALYYSLDDGLTWILIDQWSGLVTFYDWTVIAQFSAYARFKIEITTWAGSMYTETTGFTFNLAPNYLEYTFGGPWHMISIPLLPADNRVISVFGDDISGPYFVYDFHNTGCGYCLTDSVFLGSGYWLALMNSSLVDLAGEPEVDSLALVLDQGWNIVGTAIPTQIEIADLYFTDGMIWKSYTTAVNDGWILPTLYGYDPVGASYFTTAIFDVWGGYWLKTLQAGLQMITYAPSPYTSDGIIADDEIDRPSERNWRLPIKLTQGTLSEHLSGLGMRPDATDDYDVWYDIVLPPTPPSGDYLRVVFDHPEWGSPAGDRFSRDMRAPFENSGSEPNIEIWEFVIEASDNGVVEVNFANVVERIPEGYNGFAIYSGNVVDFRRAHSFTFDYIEPLPITVQIFNRAAMEAGLMDQVIAAVTLPTEYSLSGFYPNPFNPRSSVQFALPQAEQVSLKIYNIRGDLVATLVEGWRAAGVYEATFDGSNLASGVYIYQLTAGEFKSNGKLILMK
ncbi:MAG: SBBP repeat-containing protein [bacterium]